MGPKKEYSGFEFGCTVLVGSLGWNPASNSEGGKGFVVDLLGGFRPGLG